MSLGKMFGIGLGALVLVLALAFGLRAFGLVSFQFFGPQEEAARREVFEESKAFRDGMVTELRNMQFQYVQASPEHKAGLRSIALQRVNAWPASVPMPPDLAAWVAELRREVTP